MGAASVIVPLVAASPQLIKSGIELADYLKARKQDPGAPASSQAITRPPTSPARAVSKPRVEAPREASRTESARAGAPEFDAAQHRAARVIVARVRTEPLPGALDQAREALALALLVNAWVESRLRPEARNTTGEDSIGLFQINRRAHPGYSVAELVDPAGNTRAILDLIARDAARFDAFLKRGATIAALTAAVTYWVERPKHRKRKARQRAELARTWYGATAEARALGWRPRSAR